MKHQTLNMELDVVVKTRVLISTTGFIFNACFLNGLEEIISFEGKLDLLPLGKILCMFNC